MCVGSCSGQLDVLQTFGNVLSVIDFHRTALIAARLLTTCFGNHEQK